MDTPTNFIQRIEENPNAPPFDLVRLMPDAALAAAPEFRALIELWLTKCPEGAVNGIASIPDWSDFDFADFRGWHADMVLSIFPDPDEPDPEFRIAGETYSQIVDGPVKGTRFSDSWPRLYGVQFRRHFQAIRDTGLVGLAEGRHATMGRGHITLRVLELPCRDGGTVVARLIHGVRVTFE